MARSASMYTCVVAGLACPSQRAITVTSTPDWSKCIAVVCRSVCGEMRRLVNDGHALVAVAMALARLSSIADRESRLPLLAGNSGASEFAFVSRSHDERSRQVLGQ